VKKAWALILIALAIFAGSFVVGYVASATTTQGKLPSSMNHPCKEEDSWNCFWDAGARGNKKGHSFVVRAMPSQNLVCWMYNKKADRHWDHCEKKK
jgi:hypothetical protein